MRALLASFFIVASTVRFLFKHHPFFPARIPRECVQDVCATHSLPLSATGIPAEQAAESKAQSSIFRSNRLFKAEIEYHSSSR